MTERDENGLTRRQWEARNAFNTATTDESLAKEERELASQGVNKSTHELLQAHVYALLDELEKEDE